MRLLVMGLGSSFETTGVQFSLPIQCLVTSFGQTHQQKLWKNCVERRIHVHEWQPKVKRVMTVQNAQ